MPDCGHIVKQGDAREPAASTINRLGMTLIYALPGWLDLILIVALCVVLACAGHVLVHRSFKAVSFIEHNEVAGFIIAVVGVLYAVILGFLTVIVWEHYAQSDERKCGPARAAMRCRRWSWP